MISVRFLRTFALLFFFPFLAFAQTYSGDQFSGGSVTCSSADATAVCSRTIDGNESTEWYSNNVMPSNWVIDLTTSTTTDRIGIRMNNTGGDHLLRDFEVSGSSDNVSYTSLGTFEFADLNNWQYFNLTSSAAYRYYKVNITDNWRADNYVGFYEIEGYECLDCGGSGTTTPIATTTLNYQDWIFAETVQTFLLSFIGIGILFSVFRAKR